MQAGRDFDKVTMPMPIINELGEKKEKNKVQFTPIQSISLFNTKLLAFVQSVLMTGILASLLIGDIWRLFTAP